MGHDALLPRQMRGACLIPLGLSLLIACDPIASHNDTQPPPPPAPGAPSGPAPGDPAPAPSEPASQIPPEPAPAEPAPAEPAPAPAPAPSGVSPEDAALSRSLNAQGFDLYKQKRYPEAIDRFEAAAKADPTYALPPYNLACTLCLIRGGELTCEEDAYLDRILDLVETSIALDPARLDRAKEDTDLTCIHKTLRYQKLLGFSPSDPKDIPHLLTSVRWLGPAPGAFGNMSELTFLKGGKVTFWELDVTDAVKKLTYTGTYVVTGQRVDVRLDRPTKGGVEGFTGVISETGIVTDSSLGPFTDIPSECSA